MLEGKTKSGFKFSLDRARMNDMEYIELVAEAQDNILVIPKVLIKLLGEEQKNALYDHVRTEDGRVPLDAIDAEFNEIMGANEETKN